MISARQRAAGGSSRRKMSGGSRLRNAGTPSSMQRAVMPRGGGQDIPDRAASSRGVSPTPVGRASPSKEEEEEDRAVQANVLSSARLDALTSENPEALEEIQRVIKASSVGDFSLGMDRADATERRELRKLVTLTEPLVEIVVQHSASKEVAQKELSLPPDSQEYYAAFRSGLCRAYLAASVVCSRYVDTSKTGLMGKIGTGVKLMSGVPVVGIAAGPLAAAFKKGDKCLQISRLGKIADLAPDSMECCALARRLGLRLADGLPDGAISSSCNDGAVRVGVIAEVDEEAGESGSSRGIGALPECEDEDDLLDAASFNPNDCGGKRLGKKHLRAVLKAVRDGCIEGVGSMDQKVERLFLEVFPRANNVHVATLSSPAEVPVQGVASAPQNDDSSDHAAEIESLKLQMQQLRVKAKKNEAKIAQIEEMLPEDSDESGDPKAGDGGLLFAKKQKTKTETKEMFWLNAVRNQELDHVVRQSQLREFQSKYDEQLREHDAAILQLQEKNNANGSNRKRK